MDLFIVIVLLACLFLVLVGFKNFFCFYCKSKVCLNGKTAIITGGSSGIGYQTALTLASHGCRVIIADMINYEEAAQQIAKETHNTNVIGRKIDNRSFKSVREFAKEIIHNEPRLDILINNAGIASALRTLTEDGLQVTMQVNYYSHFLLTILLLDLLKKSAPSRIVFTSSILSYVSNISEKTLHQYQKKSEPMNILKENSYCCSKLCMAGASKLLAERLNGTGVTSNALHPGGVRSKIFFRHLDEEKGFFIALFGIVAWLFCKTLEQGAQTSIYLAQADEVENISGKFFMDGRPVLQPFGLRNKRHLQNLWSHSIKYTDLREDEIKV